MEIGEKIALQRRDKDLSLAELSQRAQLNEEQLEKIESGAIAPSLGTLIKLSRVLGIRLGTFLDDVSNKGLVITRKDESGSSFNLAASGAGQSENLLFTSLARAKNNRHMDPFLIEVKPVESDDNNLSSHEGEEFLFVLSGSLKVIYGRENHVLKAGDSIYYDSIVDHRVQTASNEKTIILAVVFMPV